MRMRTVLTPFSIKIAIQYKAKLDIIKRPCFFVLALIPKHQSFDDNDSRTINNMNAKLRVTVVRIKTVQRGDCFNLNNDGRSITIEIKIRVYK